MYSIKRSIIQFIAELRGKILKVGQYNNLKQNDRKKEMIFLSFIVFYDNYIIEYLSHQNALVEIIAPNMERIFF